MDEGADKVPVAVAGTKAAEEEGAEGEAEGEDAEAEAAVQALGNTNGSSRSLPLRRPHPARPCAQRR